MCGRAATSVQDLACARWIRGVMPTATVFAGAVYMEADRERCVQPGRVQCQHVLVRLNVCPSYEDLEFGVRRVETCRTEPPIMSASKIAVDFSRAPTQKERERLTLRLRRLYDMEESYRKATANLASLAQGGKAKEVRIRDDFLYRLESAPGDASDRRLPAREYRPPASRIMNSRGATLRLMLIALFEVQMRVRPGGRPDNPRPLQAIGATIGWTDLLATDAKAAGAGRSRMSVAAKKGRHLFSAIENLAKEELVSLPHGADTRNKHRGFLLNWEGGQRQVGATPLYTVPKANEPYFTLPLAVFTHGWIHGKYSEVL